MEGNLIMEMIDIIDEINTIERAYEYWKNNCKEISNKKYFNVNLLDFYLFSIKARDYYKKQLKKLNKIYKQLRNEYYS